MPEASLEHHYRMAADLVAAYNSADSEAAARLNDLFRSAIDIEKIRDFIRDKLCNLPDTQRRIDNFTLDDAQLLVARLYGFDDWNGLIRSTSEPSTDPRSAPFVLSSKPPFY